jgi:hypothetical protein
MKNRFCYSYQPQPIAQPCCPPRLEPECITISTLSTMSSLSSVIFNSKGASSQAIQLSMNLQKEKQRKQEQVDARLSTILGSASTIQSTLQGQLESQVESRYTPYYRREPERMPESVLELERMTRNVGVPIPVMTIANCKGVQFVTK